MCDKKVCKKCLIEKDLSEFGNNKSKKDNLDIYCKDCNRLKAKNLRETYKILPEYKCCKNCSIKKPNSDFYMQSSSVDGLSYTCIECCVIKRKEQYQKRKEKDSEYHKQKRISLKNKDPEKLRQKDRNSYYRNKERVKEDPLYKLSKNIRTRILLSMNSIKKQKRTHDILGCTIEEFKAHIESQFLNWMNWDNYGNYCDIISPNCSWDLDHIIPVSKGRNEEEIYLLNHWSNYQPLCSYDNRHIKRDLLYDCCNTVLNITTDNFLKQ